MYAPWTERLAKKTGTHPEAIESAIDHRREVRQKMRRAARRASFLTRLGQMGLDAEGNAKGATGTLTPARPLPPGPAQAEVLARADLSC